MSGENKGAKEEGCKRKKEKPLKGAPQACKSTRIGHVLLRERQKVMANSQLSTFKKIK